MVMVTNQYDDPYLILERAHDDFAIVPIETAFNWDQFAIYANLSKWYLVAFRSTRKENVDVSQLNALDNMAHNDAAMQPGFLFYFKGKILPGASHRKNLSFCMWENRNFARAAAQRQMHLNASAVALNMYDAYVLERYEAHVARDNKKTRVVFESVV
jgi:hypothetical protein